MTEQNFIQSSFNKEEDVQFEVPLRPQSLTDFIGQESIIERLSILIEAAKQRGDSLGHCLFSGPPGLGKTTLANILAKAMGTKIVVTTGPVIERPGDLAGILTNLEDGDILFIDEIHRLSPAIEEYLYPAMEDYALDIMIDSGTNARSVQVKLNKFTLVGATTRSGLLSSPLRSRFALTCRLDHYSPDVLVKIIDRTSRILNITLDHLSLFAIATRARGTPRIANTLLRWVRDYSQTRAKGHIDDLIVKKALLMLDIDHKGLDEMDIKILETLIQTNNGSPVGLNTLAAIVGEEPSTIEEVHEPFLIAEGFVLKTPKGRVASPLAYEHLKNRNNTNGDNI